MRMNFSLLDAVDERVNLSEHKGVNLSERYRGMGHRQRSACLFPKGDEHTYGLFRRPPAAISPRVVAWPKDPHPVEASRSAFLTGAAVLLAGFVASLGHRPTVARPVDR